MSLSSMATSASVSTPSSIGTVGAKGTAAVAPTAAPTPADARDALTIRLCASSSVLRPGNCACSVARLRIGTRGAISRTCAVSHWPLARSVRQAAFPLAWAPRLAMPRPD